MSSQEASSNDLLPNLVVNECLFGCNGCPGIWTNSQTGHRIICRCVCGHRRYKKEKREDIGPQDASQVGSQERLADANSSAFVENNSLQHPRPTKDRDTIPAEEDAIPVR